jgi:hypothetical protein
MLPARALTGAARLRAVASAVPPHPDAGGAPHRGVRGPRGGAASPKRRPLSGAPPAAAPAAAAAALAAEPPSQGAALLAALGRYRALVLDASCEFSSVLGWPVEAENVLETYQPTNHSLVTDPYPKKNIYILQTAPSTWSTGSARS